MDAVGTSGTAATVRGRAHMIQCVGAAAVERGRTHPLRTRHRSRSFGQILDSSKCANI